MIGNCCERLFFEVNGYLKIAVWIALGLIHHQIGFQEWSKFPI
jgi:catechol-2,3-dioxygenase